jgi:hypothetical protein
MPPPKSREAPTQVLSSLMPRNPRPYRIISGQTVVFKNAHGIIEDLWVSAHIQRRPNDFGEELPVGRQVDR